MGCYSEYELVHNLLIGLLVFIVVFAIPYIYMVRWEAKNKVNTAPRADMFLCPVHGPIQSKHLFHIDIGSDKPMPYCPQCFNDRCKQAMGKK